MSSFKHIILTRYNLAIDVDDGRNLDVGWLDGRRVLFEKYCLPSLMNQSCDDFVWLMFCDYRTDDAHKRDFERWQAQCPQMRVVYLPFGDDDFYRSRFSDEVRLAAADADYVITSRVDSDDALALDFVRMTQRSAAKTGFAPQIICFPNGQQYFERYHTKLNIRYPDNHFISRVEVGTDVHTVLGFDHRYAADYGDVRYYCSDCVMWCQTVHGSNISNDFHRRLRPMPERNSFHDWAVWLMLYARHIIQVVGRVMRKLFVR